MGKALAFTIAYFKFIWVSYWYWSMGFPFLCLFEGCTLVLPFGRLRRGSFNFDHLLYLGWVGLTYTFCIFIRSVWYWSIGTRFGVPYLTDVVLRYLLCLGKDPSLNHFLYSDQVRSFVYTFFGTRLWILSDSLVLGGRPIVGLPIYWYILLSTDKRV
jgi:hypothetical protein